MFTNRPFFTNKIKFIVSNFDSFIASRGSISVLILMLFCLLISVNCDKKHEGLTALDETTFPGVPKSIVTKVGDKQIALSWAIENANDIKSYHIFRKDSTQSEVTLLDTCDTRQYLDTSVKNGMLYFYQISASDSNGYEGKRSDEVSAMPNIFDVIINNGEEYTNNRSVALKITVSYIIKAMLIANDSLFSNSSGWEPFSFEKSWTLSPGDGNKYVYIKFRDHEGNETSAPARDGIILDTRAFIDEVTENTDAKIKVPGQYIHFTINAGEVDGRAVIDIGTERMGIKLYDDGTNGDSQADNGIYEIDYKIPSGFEVMNAVITGHFTDRANNSADDVTAPGRVTVQQDPYAVTLSLPVPSGAAQKSLALYWSKSTDDDFACYRLFRATSSGVDTSSFLVTTILEMSTTNYTDSDVRAETEYFYRVFVYDRFGLARGSNEVVGKIDPSEKFPTRVTLYPPSPVMNSLTSLNLSWSENEDNDFASYKIYRSKTPGVDSTAVLITTLSDQNTTNYEDTNLQENTGYYYRVYVYNISGLSTGSNEEVGKTSANEPPIPVTLYPPSAIGNSLTALNLSWSKNEDTDFSSYKIFRSKTAGVDSTSILVTTISEQNTTSYEDSELQANTEYYYRVYVYDTRGLSVGSNEKLGKTSANEPPTPVTLYPPSAIGNSLTALSLSWSQNEDNDFSSYKIFRSKTAGVDSTSILVTTISEANTTSYEDNDLQANTEYYYRVYVYDTRGLSVGSNEKMGKTSANEPPTPVMLYPPSAIGSSLTALNLSWSKNEDNDFSSYKIFRSKTAGVDSTSILVTTISEQNTTSYEDSDLMANTEYYYRVYVYDNRGLSAGSNEKMGKTSANEPPTAVSLNPPSPIGNSLTSLSLSWSQNENNDFVSYRIYRAKAAGVDSTCILVTTISDQNTTNYDDTNLQADTEYYYRVYVYDSGGLSAGSNEEMGKTNANETPTAVTLYLPSPVGNSSSALSLSWSQNNDSDFASYKIYRADSEGVDSSSVLVTTISNQNSTNYDDTDLHEDTEYYYIVYVYDTGGLSAGSNEEMGKTNANEPPEKVILAQPSVVDSVTLHLSWSQNNDDDFSMYSIYRSESSPVDTVDTTNPPIAIINNRQTTSYDDNNLETNKEYFYCIIVTDQGGEKSAASNEVSGTPKP